MTSFSPEYWRERAEETRAKAEGISDVNARDKLLRVCGEYEQLAQRAEQWRTVEKKEPVGSERSARAEQPPTVEKEPPAGSVQARFLQRLLG